MLPIIAQPWLAVIFFIARNMISTTAATSHLRRPDQLLAKLSMSCVHMSMHVHSHIQLSM